MAIAYVNDLLPQGGAPAGLRASVVWATLAARCLLVAELSPCRKRLLTPDSPVSASSGTSTASSASAAATSAPSSSAVLGARSPRWPARDDSSCKIACGTLLLSVQLLDGLMPIEFPFVNTLVAVKPLTHKGTHAQISAGGMFHRQGGLPA